MIKVAATGFMAEEALERVREKSVSSSYIVTGLLVSTILPSFPSQIFSVAILLHTSVVCRTPIVVPILAAYGGVATRCIIVLSGFYRLVYPKLKKETVVSLNRASGVMNF